MQTSCTLNCADVGIGASRREAERGKHGIELAGTQGGVEHLHRLTELRRTDMLAKILSSDWAGGKEGRERLKAENM